MSLQETIFFLVNIGPEEVKLLAEIINSNSYLEEFNLNKNSIEEEEINCLSSSVKPIKSWLHDIDMLDKDEDTNI